MKKDRNTFFSEYGFNQMNQMNQGPNMMMPGGGIHHHGGAHDSMPSHHMPMPTDIDSRIAKLERAINRLETRISKLEGDGHITQTDHETHFNNSMYMV